MNSADAPPLCLRSVANPTSLSTRPTRSAPNSSGLVSKLSSRSLGDGQLSDTGNIVGWCAYLYEEATGMWLARNRWQIPELGRWANRDPIGYAGGGQNLYEYVNGNPVFLQDPMDPH